MKKFLAIAVATALLTGCGDTAIEQVQNLSIENKVEYTYGKVLNNRRVCEKIDWKSDTVDGISTVTYSCLLNKGKKFINYDQNEVEVMKKKVTAEFLENVKTVHKLKYDVAVKDLEEANKSINMLKEIRDNKDYMTAVTSNGFLFEAFCLFLTTPEGKQFNERLGGMVNTLVPNPEIAYHYFRLLNDDSASQPIRTLAQEFQPAVHKLYIQAVEKRFGEFEEQKNLAEARLKAHAPDVVDDNDKENLAKFVDAAVIDYEKNHATRGEEMLVWEYNAVTEKYILKKSTFVMKFKNYEDVKYDFNMAHALYAATHNINNVDEYLSYRIANR